MKKILVISVEPPPTSSGLGTLWAKLSLGMQDTPLEMDFMGPDPGVSSPYGLSGLNIPGKLYPFTDPPLSRKISVRRNQTHGVPRIYWSILRIPFYLNERFLGNSYLDWITKKIEGELPKLLSNNNFDALAVHVPPLNIAKTVRDCAVTAGIPFVYVVGDPQGYRDTDGAFYPQDKSLAPMFHKIAASPSTRAQD